MRKMQFVIKVPRLRDQYLAQNGVDPFIEKFTTVVAEHQAVIEEIKATGVAQTASARKFI